MFAIYMKKINQASAQPIMHSQQTSDIKKARKFRLLHKAIEAFDQCCLNHPEYLWQIRDTKTHIVCFSNSANVLPIWNKMLGREV